MKDRENKNTEEKKEQNKENKETVDMESQRIKEQRRTEFRDEALNPTQDAMQTGRSDKPKDDKSKAVRNANSYDDEFGSKKAGPGGYGDRAKMPLTDRKRDQDAKQREKEMEQAEKEKNEKQDQKRERQKKWGE